MSLGLIFETSTKAPFILAVQGGSILKKILLNHDKLSIDFFPCLQKIRPLKETLKFIATSIGPGSYTGTRLGICTAKTFAYTLGIPLLSFSSLESFIPSSFGPFLNLLDAKSGGVYSMQGKKTKEDCMFKAPEIHSIEKTKKLMQPFDSIFSLDSFLLNRKLDSTAIKQGQIDLNYLSTRLYFQFLRKNFMKHEELTPLYLRR